MKVVNGKTYPMWDQFLEKKQEWVGGVLEDFGDNMDRTLFGDNKMATEIVDITLEPNGEDSAFFSIVGKEFSCGFDVKHGGISGEQNGEDWLTFAGYGGHKFRIKKKEVTEDDGE